MLQRLLSIVWRQYHSSKEEFQQEEVFTCVQPQLADQDLHNDVSTFEMCFVEKRLREAEDLQAWCLRDL